MRRPDTSEDIKSLPALAVTIVLWAPETAVRDIREENVRLKCENKFVTFLLSRNPVITMETESLARS